jgi:transposase InsO family protein
METKNRACTYGERVHTDLWGPAQTASTMGCSYYISFTDDYSRETKVQFLKHKSEALTTFKQYEANITRQHPGVKLCKVHSDRGGEYLSAEFDQYLKNQGIERELTVHHSPQQNRVAEQLNQTLVEHTQAMLLA